MKYLINFNKRILACSLVFLTCTLIFANSTHAAVIVTKVMTSELAMFKTSSFVATSAPQTFKCFASEGSVGDCFISRASGYYQVLDVGNIGEPNSRQMTVT